MKVVIDSFIPYLADVLVGVADVRVLRGDALTSADMVGVDALFVRTRTRCDRALLEGSGVKFVGTATIGYDHIDCDYLDSMGISFSSAAGCNARGVLQWVSAVLAHLSRTQGWNPQDMTLGVVGVGFVGGLVVEYARSWGFRVLCSDPPRERQEGLGERDGFVSFEELSRRCDIISFHTPLTHFGVDKSFHLADKAFFDNIKRGVVVLNSSRGGVVDSDALLGAVRDGLCSCCLDVWEGEPSDVSVALLGLSIVATPHIAGYSLQGKANASAIVLQGFGDCFGLDFADWYPVGVSPSSPRAISWGDMCERVGEYCDVVGDTRSFRDAPTDLERLRDTYLLREEFF